MSEERSNVNRAMDFFMNDIKKESEGEIDNMSKEQAAALVGNFIVETGSSDLSDLDVVEQGSGKGRGLAQYTGPRRVAYDKAAESAGKDAKTMDWQLRYMMDEYLGKHDTDGKSLSGYTKSLSNIPGDLQGATDHFTSKYFKPSVPHADKRFDAAQRVLSQFKPRANGVLTTTNPSPRAPQQPTPIHILQGMQQQMQNIQRNIDLKNLSQQLKGFFGG